jgi:hypothetical protein
MTGNDRRYEEAVEAFFAIHATDPRKVEREGQSLTWSVLYHTRMLAWLARLAPGASEPLKLAAACQHIRRWDIPREHYPEGKLGYKKWRHDLALYHGDQAAAILEEKGYDAKTVARVKSLLLKENLKSDPETQALEDAICLVFLENAFVDFARKHDEEKLAVVLRKTWKKMSERGHVEARNLASGLPQSLQALMVRALG